MNRKLFIFLAAMGMLAGGTASADDFLCSAIGPIISSDINGNVFVDVNCTVTGGAFINGNMTQTALGSNLIIERRAEVNGYLDQ